MSIYQRCTAAAAAAAAFILLAFLHVRRSDRNSNTTANVINSNVINPTSTATSLSPMEGARTESSATTVLAPCRGTAYTVGRWVPTNLTSKPFVCCGGKNRFVDHDFEKHNDFTDPTVMEYCMVGNRTKNTVGTYLEMGIDGNTSSHCGDDCCRCDRDDGTRFRPNPRENYVWTPSTCALHTWNATWFCELLGARTVLFVGDSTMQQVHEHVGDT